MQALFYYLGFYAPFAIKTDAAFAALVLFVDVVVTHLAVLAADAVGLAEHAFDVCSAHSCARLFVDHGFTSGAGRYLIATAVLTLTNADNALALALVFRLGRFGFFRGFLFGS